VNLQLDPSITAEFAHTVYRFGHTMLTDTVSRTAPDGTADDVPLVEAFLNPLGFAESGASPEEAAGAILRGLAGQTGNEIDEFVTEGVRNNLLGLPLDLATLNLARGRDTGIPPLNDARSQFQDAAHGDARLAPYDNWTEFGGALRHPESLINFIAAYGTHPTVADAETVEDKRAAAMALVLGGEGAPADRLDFLAGTGDWSEGGGAAATGLDDVDFWIGGLAEAPMGQGLLGPTFNYVFETQLENLQNGDRFYYLNRTAGMNFFTQLEESSLAEMIMRNTDAANLSFDVFDAPGSGNTVVGGTDAADQLAGTDGDNTLWGNDGDDNLEGGTGNDALAGGAGNDTISDVSGDEVIKGGDGNDTIDSVPGVDLVLAGSGDDYVLAREDEIFAGQGNDIVLAGELSDTVQGNEGDDWLEGGDGDDVLIGDDNNPAGMSTIEGHDVLVGAGGGNLLTGEHGDDIFLGGDGFNTSLGMTGFDWASYERSTAGVTADLARSAEPSANAAAAADASEDLFSGVEALSGSPLDDVLRGDDADQAELAAMNEAGLDNALAQSGVERVSGLSGLLGGSVSFASGNLLLGGAGSDELEGRGGDDVLDGDAFLHVELSQAAAGGTIVREIRMPDQSNATDVDTAIFSEDAANYDVTANADGSTSVRHARGSMDDGTDILRNIEQMQFADELVVLDPARDDAAGPAAQAMPGSAPVLADGFNNVFVFGGASDEPQVVEAFDADPVGGQSAIDISELGITAEAFVHEVAITDAGADTLVTIGNESMLVKGVSGDGANALNQADFLLAA
jgi:Ca2+-binding RTX toxin-like protein